MFVGGHRRLASVLLAKEDPGSGLTFIPMTVGMCYLAAYPPSATSRYAGAGRYCPGHQPDSRDGYQYRRILAPRFPKPTTSRRDIMSPSLCAVGGGGASGAGYGQGRKYHWLASETTDMIFAVIAEETGLSAVWSCWRYGRRWRLVCASAAANQWRLAGVNCRIAGSHQCRGGFGPDANHRHYLPFISYGGSLVGSLAGLALCCSVSRRPVVSPNKQAGSWARWGDSMPMDETLSFARP